MWLRHCEGVLPEAIPCSTRRLLRRFAARNDRQTGVLLVDFHFAIHIQEDEPRLCFNSKLLLDCPSIARHLKVILFLCDDGAGFFVGVCFVGFEVHDMPIIVCAIEQVNDAASFC